VPKIVLIVDYENVQRVEFDRLPRDASVLFVFGARNSKVPTELLLRQQELRERFQIVAVRAVQQNAADFCVAYYLGEQLARDPSATLVVLSKDKKAFDPLITHLHGERKLAVRRVDSFNQAFPKSAASAKTAEGADDPYARVLKLLRKEHVRPTTRKALAGKLKSWLPTTGEAARVELLERLFEDGTVASAPGGLSYRI
jgi:hypothetical protein